jgi:ribonuclease PH
MTVDQGTKDRSAATRPDGRRPDEARAMTIELDVAPAAAGSALVTLGNTRVLCAAMIEERVPRWMREQRCVGGWLTAEYSLLPYSTVTRTSRESSLGRVGGRTMEIQRMIGRSLRAITDLRPLGARTIWIDCDVLRADGGTRTAAISGAYVALAVALRRARAEGRMAEVPLRDSIAAVSVGVVEGCSLLDLCYAEDAAADVDLNVVMTGDGRIVEVQGAAERQPFAREQFDALLDLARGGIETWTRTQIEALRVLDA